jgi:hypothetical protein
MAMFNFYEVPRAFGTPSQTVVKTEEDLHRLIHTNIGKTPIFISHNSFPAFVKNKVGFEEPSQVNVSKIFLDFDSDRKPENAQLDAIKVIDFCESENLPFIVAFSGSKGFHIYIALKPTVYNYGQFLKDATKAIHVWLQQKLGLRTLDLKCAEPRRLCRVFYTPHVKTDKKTGKAYANGMYCCPLEPMWVRDWRMEQIMRFAMSPVKINYKPKGYCITLDDFLTKFDINIEEMLKASVSESCSSRNSLVEYIPVNDEYIKSILPLPCIHSQIAHNPNPCHFARFAAACWLHDIGLDRSVAFKFFKARNYVDHKDDVCATQINNIYDHGYKFPSCSKLYENSLCVGKACPKFEAFARRSKIVAE